MNCLNNSRIYDITNKDVCVTKNGWIYLGNLCRKKTKFDWDASIGKTIPFQYDDIKSYATIVGKKDSQYIYISIPNYTSSYPIAIGQLKKGQLGGALKKITSEYRYNIGDVVNDMLILSQYKVKNMYKYYDYQCLKDGYVGHIREDHLMTDHKCPVCLNKVVIKGINDILTTRKDIADLFLYDADKIRYTEHSGKSVYFKCPRCGNIIYAVVNSVSAHGLRCKKCGDGISYPNKFIYNFVEQLSKLYDMRGQQILFYPEKSFSWSYTSDYNKHKSIGRKIYDMYIDSYNIIIENHGAFHYKDGSFNFYTKRSLKEIQENDCVKKELALLNHIQEDRYIVLDCSKSDMNYIKHSIMCSNLPKLLSFTEVDIDWCQCHKFAVSSRVYEACMHWNNGIKIRSEIAKIMHVSKTTINRYIKQGIELGIVSI